MRIIATIAILSSLVVSCGKSPEDARKELGQMGLSYDEDTFINRVAAGDLIAVKLFLLAGMSIDTREGEPLGAAARAGQVEMVKFLIDRGANLHAPFGGHGTPLINAVSGKNLEIARLLIEKGATLSASSLIKAVETEQLEMVKLIVDKGADVNAEYGSGAPLHVAARGRSLEIVRLLIEKGADVNAKDEYGLTPLHYASGNRSYEIVRLLLDKGADANAKDKGGRRPDLSWIRD